MKNNIYKKEYPFTKQILLEKLKDRTISSPIKMLFIPYENKIKDRAFELYLKKNKFQIHTYPTHSKKSLYPSSIYGTIHELNG